MAQPSRRVYRGAAHRSARIHETTEKGPENAARARSRTSAGKGSCHQTWEESVGGHEAVVGRRNEGSEARRQRRDRAVRITRDQRIFQRFPQHGTVEAISARRGW